VNQHAEYMERFVRESLPGQTDTTDRLHYPSHTWSLHINKLESTIYAAIS